MNDSQIYLKAAELVFNYAGCIEHMCCCSAISEITNTDLIDSPTHIEFREYFKPINMTKLDYWFGSTYVTDGVTESQLQDHLDHRIYALLLMSEISKEYTPKSLQKHNHG